MFRPELSGFRTIPKARWVVVSPHPPANSLTHRPALPTSLLVLSTHHPIAPYRGQKSSWDYQPARYSQLKMATATMLRTAAIMSFLATRRVDAADTVSKQGHRQTEVRLKRNSVHPVFSIFGTFVPRVGGRQNPRGLRHPHANLGKHGRPRSIVPGEVRQRRCQQHCDWNMASHREPVG